MNSFQCISQCFESMYLYRTDPGENWIAFNTLPFQMSISKNLRTADFCPAEIWRPVREVKVIAPYFVLHGKHKQKRSVSTWILTNISGIILSSPCFPKHWSTHTISKSSCSVLVSSCQDLTLFTGVWSFFVSSRMEINWRYSEFFHLPHPAGYKDRRKVSRKKTKTEM